MSAELFSAGEGDTFAAKLFEYQDNKTDNRYWQYYIRWAVTPSRQVAALSVLEVMEPPWLTPGPLTHWNRSVIYAIDQETAGNPEKWAIIAPPVKVACITSIRFSPSGEQLLVLGWRDEEYDSDSPPVFFLYDKSSTGAWVHQETFENGHEPTCPQWEPWLVGAYTEILEDKESRAPM